jgi:hypothetical protein
VSPGGLSWSGVLAGPDGAANASDVRDGAGSWSTSGRGYE